MFWKRRKWWLVARYSSYLCVLGSEVLHHLILQVLNLRVAIRYESVAASSERTKTGLIRKWQTCSSSLGRWALRRIVRCSTCSSRTGCWWTAPIALVSLRVSISVHALNETTLRISEGHRKELLTTDLPRGFSYCWRLANNVGLRLLQESIRIHAPRLPEWVNACLLLVRRHIAGGRICSLTKYANAWCPHPLIKGLEGHWSIGNNGHRALVKVWSLRS